MGFYKGDKNDARQPFGIVMEGVTNESLDRANIGTSLLYGRRSPRVVKFATLEAIVKDENIGRVAFDIDLYSAKSQFWEHQGEVAFNKGRNGIKFTTHPADVARALSKRGVDSGKNEMNKRSMYFTNSRVLWSLSIGGVFLTLSSLLALGYSEMDTFENIKPLIVIKDANRPSLSFDGKRIVETPEIGLSEVYNVDTGEKIRSFNLHNSESQAISQDGKKIVIFHDKVVGTLSNGFNKTESVHSIFDIESGRLLSEGSTEVSYHGKLKRKLSVFNQAGLNSRNISADLDVIAIASGPDYRELSNPNPEHPAVIIGSIHDRVPVKELKTNEAFMSGDVWKKVEMTQNAKFVAAHRHNEKNPGRDKTIVWNAVTGKVIFDLQSYKLISISENGERIAVEESGNGGTIEFRRVLMGQLVSRLAPKVLGNEILINQAVLSPDGKWLVTTRNEDFYFWDTDTGKFFVSQKQADITGGNVKSVVFSGDGKRIAVGSDTEVVTVWSVDDILSRGKK